MKSLYSCNVFQHRHSLRVYLLSFLLLLVLALAACGGNEASQATSPEEGADQAVDQAAPAEDTATGDTAAAGGVTAATAEPAEIEPPIAELPPTEAPATVESEPAASPTPGTDTSTNLPIGDCANPFFPVVEGRVLTYRTTLGELGESEYTQTFSDVTAESFTVTMVVSDTVITNQWTCTGDGLLAPSAMQLSGSLPDLNVQTLEADGLTVPAALEEGDSWATHYKVSTDMAGEDGAIGQMIQTMDMTSTVAGEEEITVPAGTYPNAVRVDTTGTIAMAIMMGEQEQPFGNFDMTYTSWYVEGVGIVKQQMDDLLGEGGTGASLVELVSVE